MGLILTLTNILNIIIILSGFTLIYFTYWKSLPQIIFILSLSIVFFGCTSLHGISKVTKWTPLLLLALFIILSFQCFTLFQVYKWNIDFYTNKVNQTYQNIYALNIEDSPIHDLQYKYNCCGYFSYKDWNEKKNKLIPGSCCDVIYNSYSCPIAEVLNKEGCQKYIDKEWRNMWNNSVFLYAPMIVLEIAVFTLFAIYPIIKPDVNAGKYVFPSIMQEKLDSINFSAKYRKTDINY